MRIVIVEDHPIILQVLTAALGSVEGYAVQGFSSARAGLDACLGGVDLAIFDHRLPDMTSTEALQILRANPQTRHLPVIVITGDNDAGTRMNAIKAGATDFLNKPVNIDELRLRVRNLLALHEAQKQAEQREELLEIVIAASKSSIAVADARLPETPILFASEALLALNQCRADEVIGQRHHHLWRHVKPAPARDAMCRATEQRLAHRAVLETGRADGTTFWTEIVWQPVPRPGAEAHYLVITQSDVSDMVAIRAAHQHLTERLSDIARVSGAWFFEIDAQGRLSYVSDAMAQALSLGEASRPVLGLHVDELKAGFADPERAGEPLSALFRVPAASLAHQMLAFHMPDGKTRTVQVSLAPFQDEVGRHAGYRGYAGDVSEIAEARDQAKRASRAKSAFLATMSHEMRTPLTGILGMVEILAQGISHPQQVNQLDHIRSAAAALSDVLGNVLDVASLESGKLALDIAAFDPVAVVRGAVDEYRPQARGKGLALDLALDAGLQGSRRGDAQRLRQILRNLLSNAVKFTEAGSVTVRLDRGEGDELRLSVSDTGIGMGADDLARACQPFLQGDDRMERRFGGSGLGLAIVRWLVDAMSGDMQIESEPGRGTRVSIRLPLAALARQPAPAPGLDLNGRHVLVADDNRVNRQILDTLLRRMGAEVTLCEDGVEAMNHWQQDRFDLVLLDINMPNMAGTDVMRAIRQTEAGQIRDPVPAVAVTANTFPDQLRQYREVGFDGWIGKPFTSATLAGSLRDILQARASARDGGAMPRAGTGR